MKYLIHCTVLLIFMFTNPTWAADDHGHANDLSDKSTEKHNDEHVDKHESEEGGVELTPAQLQAAGIVVSELQPSNINNPSIN